jgi:hypothetical protein
MPESTKPRARRGKVTRNETTGKIVPQRFTLSEIQAADARHIGFCVACGAEVECCEPDARARPCGACGLKGGYGAQEFFIRGWMKDEAGRPINDPF